MSDFDLMRSFFEGYISPKLDYNHQQEKIINVFENIDSEINLKKINPIESKINLPHLNNAWRWTYNPKNGWLLYNIHDDVYYYFDTENWCWSENINDKLAPVLLKQLKDLLMKANRFTL